MSVEGFQSWKDSVDNLVQPFHLEIRQPGREAAEGLTCSPGVPVALTSDQDLLDRDIGVGEKMIRPSLIHSFHKHLLSAC